MGNKGGSLNNSSSRGPVRLFRRGGWLEGTIRTAGGESLLVVTAGAKAGGGRPSLEAWLDGGRIGRLELEAGRQQYLRRDYPLRFAADPGEHRLKIVVIPPPAGGGPVYIDRLTFERPPG